MSHLSRLVWHFFLKYYDRARGDDFTQRLRDNYMQHLVASVADCVTDAWLGDESLGDESLGEGLHQFLGEQLLLNHITTKYKDSKKYPQQPQVGEFVTCVLDLWAMKWSLANGGDLRQTRERVTAHIAAAHTHPTVDQAWYTYDDTQAVHVSCFALVAKAAPAMDRPRAYALLRHMAAQTDDGNAASDTATPIALAKLFLAHADTLGTFADRMCNEDDRHFDEGVLYDRILSGMSNLHNACVPCPDEQGGCKALLQLVQYVFRGKGSEVAPAHLDIARRLDMNSNDAVELVQHYVKAGSPLWWQQSRLFRPQRCRPTLSLDDLPGPLRSRVEEPRVLHFLGSVATAEWALTALIAHLWTHFMSSFRNNLRWTKDFEGERGEDAKVSMRPLMFALMLNRSVHALEMYAALRRIDLSVWHIYQHIYKRGEQTIAEYLESCLRTVDDIGWRHVPTAMLSCIRPGADGADATGVRALNERELGNGKGSLLGDFIDEAYGVMQRVFQGSAASMLQELKETVESTDLEPIRAALDKTRSHPRRNLFISDALLRDLLMLCETQLAAAEKYELPAKAQEYARSMDLEASSIVSDAKERAVQAGAAVLEARSSFSAINSYCPFWLELLEGRSKLCSDLRQVIESKEVERWRDYLSGKIKASPEKVVSTGLVQLHPSPHRGPHNGGHESLCATRTLCVHAAMRDVAMHALKWGWIEPRSILVAALVDTSGAATSTGNRGAVAALALAWDGFTKNGAQQPKAPWYTNLRTFLEVELEGIECDEVREEYEANLAQAVNGASFPVLWSHGIMARLERDAILDEDVRKSDRQATFLQGALQSLEIEGTAVGVEKPTNWDRETPLRYASDATASSVDTEEDGEHASPWKEKRRPTTTDVVCDPNCIAHIKLPHVLRLQAFTATHSSKPDFGTRDERSTYTYVCKRSSYEAEVEGARHIKAVMVRLEFHHG